ncbi:helix-turn-helix domain-containing protein [Saccharopolyspora elongata]|uniref:helix-turn-helix domain-containing protein n=1 Tax=Saccharopolyspora elongata TaxID=2530387 RepID=UPI001F397257|nr:helix-turn-helix domain-containing protein [Saccharopolyspora elongata]
MGNNDLGDFLRARRAGLTPDEIGLPVEFGAGRRVAGLRRGEVAQLAGVSTEYYTRLEQGRARQPSEQVLHALCDALRFDDIERRHLFALAGTTAGRKDRAEHSSQLRPALRQVLESMDLASAFVSDRNLTVVGGNTLWALLFPDVAELPRRERSELWGRSVAKPLICHSVCCLSTLTSHDRHRDRDHRRPGPRPAAGATSRPCRADHPRGGGRLGQPDVAPW